MNKNLLIESLVFIFLALISIGVIIYDNLLVLNNYLGLFSLIFILGFAGFVMYFWKERASDEREVLHMLVANRLSLLFGSIVVIIGIVVQAYSGVVDIWLFFVLMAFVLAKIISRLHSSHTK